MKTPKFLDESVCISCKQVLGVALSFVWLFRFVWIGFEKFLYKRNGEVSKELLPNFFQKPCSCFGCRLSYNHPNRVILIGKEP